MIKGFRDLDVWKKSIQLVKEVYEITKNFPKEEIYGLTNQIRRSAVSIPSNIAEGKNRQTKNEYIRFLYIALGSLAELETQIVISQELSFLSKKTEEDLLEVVDHISRMVRNLVRSLSANNREPRTEKTCTRNFITLPKSRLT